MFLLYIKAFVSSKNVLENFSRGPGKSWKSPGFFSGERVGTLVFDSQLCFDVHLLSFIILMCAFVARRAVD